MPGRTMSQLETTSAILGEYMLKGWTLTDLHCDQCRATPLMREPAAAAEKEQRDRVQFCALCDGRPGQPAPAPAISASSAPPTNALPGPSQPSSTTFDSPFGPIPAPGTSSSSSTSAAPRAVADPNDAASSISDLLLRGYSLLGDNCPNADCRGVPLVGFPRRPDGSKDGRRMCVSCEGRWVDAKFLSAGGGGGGAGMTVIQPPAPIGNVREEGGLELSPRSRARNELYGISAPSNQGKGKNVDKDAFAATAKRSADHLASGLGAGTRSGDVEMGDESEDELDDILQSSVNATAESASASSSLGLALSQTTASLSNTLQTLSSSLERHSAHPPVDTRTTDAGRWFVDLKLHTEAIKDVLSVVEQVKRAKREQL